MITKKMTFYNINNLENEIWKDIPNYEGYYQVSNLGRIKALLRKDSKNRTRNARILKSFSDGHFHKYKKVKLHRNDKAWTVYIHRLVALAFIPNLQNFPCINHKDGNSLNNKLENLEWCNHKYNTIHAWKNNLCKPNRGEKHGCSILKEKDVLEIRKLRNTEKYSLKQLASIYNVAYTTILAIINKQNWKHV